MRRRHFRQQKPSSYFIPNHRQQNHQQARKLNPLIRWLLPTPRAHRTLWKHFQPAMLAIHGNLAFSPVGDTAPAAKIVTPGKRRAYWSHVQAYPNQRPLPQSLIPDDYSARVLVSFAFPPKKRGQAASLPSLSWVSSSFRTARKERTGS